MSSLVMAPAAFARRQQTHLHDSTKDTGAAFGGLPDQTQLGVVEDALARGFFAALHSKRKCRLAATSPKLSARGSNAGRPSCTRCNTVRALSLSAFEGTFARRG